MVKFSEKINVRKFSRERKTARELSHLENQPRERRREKTLGMRLFNLVRSRLFFRVLIFSLTCGKGRKCQILAKYVAKRELKDVENVTECSTALFSASEKIGRATKRHATRASKQLQALQTTATPTNCPRQFLVVRLHLKSLFFM